MVRGLLVKKGSVKASTAASKKDVVMGSAATKKSSAKVRKRINKVKRRKSLTDRKDVAMGASLRESRKARRKRIALAGASLPQGGAEAPEVLQQRQAAEWKEMKAKVALLKKDRQKLPKKGGKSQRVAAAQAIRELIENMQVRHVAELKAAGLSTGAAPGSQASALSDSVMAE
mmetsp:Transcript_123921/g.219589  ORF Transcript_123921/g.219589 Transcript_123921/m.219589 type:complete len:173 (-) Transcript_123921:8-526(-)